MVNTIKRLRMPSYCEYCQKKTRGIEFCHICKKDKPSNLEKGFDDYLKGNVISEKEFKEKQKQEGG